MKIAVCDNDYFFVNIVEEYLERLGDIDDCEVFLNGEDLLRAFNQGESYDVIFLDIEMDGADGIDVANIIRKLDKCVLIVFITSYKEYMQRSFECLPFRFLLKPLVFDDFRKVYNEIYERVINDNETLVFYENKTRTRIYCKDILAFESNRHWIIIYKRDGSIHRIRKTIGELMIVLDNSVFVQTHRAFVVNLNWIFKMNENSISLHDSSLMIPIGRTYKNAVYDNFVKFKERRCLL